MDLEDLEVDVLAEVVPVEAGKNHHITHTISPGLKRDSVRGLILSLKQCVKQMQSGKV